MTGRNVELTREAGRLRALGMYAEQIERALLAHPARNGLPAAEIRTIARSIGKKPPGRNVERPINGWCSALHELADRRGWSVKALGALGAVAKGREVHIPMKMADGEIVGWRRRRADNQPFAGDKKVLSVQGSKAMLMMPTELLADLSSVAVVESEADAAAILSAGHAAVLANPGGKPSADCIAEAQKVLKSRTVVMFPDPDEVGDAWRKKLGTALSRAGCTVCYVPPVDCDIDERLRRGTDRGATLTKLLAGALSLNAEAADGDGVIITRGDNLKVESINWLWNGWLARGKLHILAGAPGAGKSTIAIGLAATVTSGGRWPDGTACGIAGVLVWSGEDDPADTILPRFLAAGGDPKSLHIITGMADAKGPRPFNPGTDIAALSAAARKIQNLVLLIVDPVVAAVIEDSHKNVEVRRALQPLVTLGADLGLAVLGISHFTKGTAGRDPVERVTGSLAFGALPRVVMAAAKANGERRVFCRAKSNIGPDNGGWEYRLILSDVPGAPNVTVVRTGWGNALEGNARELLADAEVVENSDDASERKRDRTRLKAAMQWLHKLLSHGGMMVEEVKIEAQAAGYAWRLIRDAKDELKINPQKAGFTEGWRWNLPEDDVHAPKEDDVTASSAEPAPDKAFTEGDVTSPWCRESTSPSASSSSQADLSKDGPDPGDVEASYDRNRPFASLRGRRANPMD